MVRTYAKRKSNYMKILLKYLLLFLFIIFFSNGTAANENDIYKKIDLFSEVLDKINKEYVDDVDQSEAMDAAINVFCNP